MVDYEKAIAAAHESGHAIVAASFGVPCKAWIEKAPEGWVGWAGKCEYRLDKTTPYPPGLRKALRDRWERRSSVASVAGLVAEYYVADDGEFGLEFDYDAEIRATDAFIDWRCEMHSPSETDLNNIPDDWDERGKLCDRAAKILEKRKEQFLEIFNRLLDTGARDYSEVTVYSHPKTFAITITDNHPDNMPTWFVRYYERHFKETAAS